MENAYILFTNMAVMLIYSAIGFILVKSKLLTTNSIKGFNVLLLYVSQPCLVYYSLTKINFETRILLNMLITFLVALLVMLVLILAFYLATRKRQEKSVALRVANVCVGFSNCTFISLPLLEALLPEYKEAAAYSIIFFFSMSIIGWTLACYITTREIRYMSIKKIILNPATLGILAFLPFFIFNFSFPEPIHSSVTLLGKMCTPLCMLILGIRLAALPLKTVVLDKSKYGVIFLRQIVAPMIYLAVCFLLPIDPNLKISLVVCGSAPVAAMVLSFAEYVGSGQEYAAGTVILSNLTSVITLPAVMLVIEKVLYK